MLIGQRREARRERTHAFRETFARLAVLAQDTRRSEAIERRTISDDRLSAGTRDQWLEQTPEFDHVSERQQSAKHVRCDRKERADRVDQSRPLIRRRLIAALFARHLAEQLLEIALAEGLRLDVGFLR